MYIIIYTFHMLISIYVQEEFEDIKGIITIRKSKKTNKTKTQHNTCWASLCTTNTYNVNRQ